MNSILTIHYWVGGLVAILALVAVWRRPERRVTLYVLTVQIILGIVLLVNGLRVGGLHPALAIVAWAGYMAANAIGRRPERRGAALAIAGISTFLIFIAFGLGQAAVKAAG